MKETPKIFVLKMDQLRFRQHQQFARNQIDPVYLRQHDSIKIFVNIRLEELDKPFEHGQWIPNFMDDSGRQLTGDGKPV